MSKPLIQLTNSFDEWRILNNTLSDNVSDIGLVTPEEVVLTSTVTASIAGTVMTVTGVTTGQLRVGQVITGAQVLPNTHITSFGTGTGGTGTYNISISQTATSSVMYGTLTTTSLLRDLYEKKVKRSGDTFTGAVQINSTLGSNGIVSFTNTTTSSLTTNGALVVSGGVGIGGTVNIGGISKITNTTTSTTTTTGALVVSGGVGIAGATYIGGATRLTVNTAATNTTTGTLVVTGGTGISGALYAGGNIFSTATTASTSTITGSIVASGGVGIAGALYVGGATRLTVNTASTSTTTGTLVVTGGTGISGSLYVGGNVDVTGTTLFKNSITSTIGTIAADTPILSATQTWNNAAVAFNGIKLNVTNTASGAGSLLLNFQLGGVDKFGVDVNGAIIQKVSGTNLARDIVAGTRHVREYQDTLDDGRQGLPGVAGISTDSFEWGFTWNAKWDATSTSYLKDRSNAGDHAFMFRVHKKYGNQWWFSDGTTAASPIAWVKKVDFDLPSNTYTFKDGANETVVTPTSLTAATVNATDKLVVGIISYFDAVEAVTTTMSQTVIATFPIATYRSATFEVQAVDATAGKFHKTNLSFIHNGTVSDSLEYGSINIGGLCATYTTRLQAGNVEILATPTTVNSTVYKIHIRLMGA